MMKAALASRYLALGAGLSLLMPAAAGAEWSSTADLPGGTVYTLIAKGGNLFAEAYSLVSGAVDGGIFRSDDNGATWVSADSGISKSETIYNPVFCGDRLFAGTQERGFRSDDSGAHWSPIDIGIAQPDPIRFMQFGGSGLYAIKRDLSVILRSDNCGDSWYFQNPIWPAKGSIEAVARSGDYLLVGSIPGFGGPDGAVYRSSDNGAIWAAVDSGLPPHPQVTAFAVTSSHVIAAVNGKGLYRSSDHGLTWSPANEGMTAPYVSALAAVGNRLFAGTGFGVFLSDDQGLTWEPASTGLPGGILIENIAATDTHLFLGTLDGKVWKLPLAEIPIAVRRAQARGRAWGFEGNAGAFLSPGADIPFTLAKGGAVDVAIFDMRGAKVRTLMRTNLGAGRHQAVLDAGGLSEGIYHLRLEAAGSAMTRRFILRNR